MGMMRRVPHGVVPAMSWTEADPENLVLTLSAAFVLKDLHM